MNQQASTQDLNDSKQLSQQSVERYLQIESTHNSVSPLRRIDEQISVQTTRTPGITSILKVQNGKFSHDVFREALNKKKSELHKRNKSQTTQETPKQRQKIEKQPKKQDKIKQNIIKAGQKQEKKEMKQKVQQKQEELEKPKVIDEQQEQAFLETVERLYNYDKRRKQQLDKAINENMEKEKQTYIGRPLINQKSCIILDKKFKQLIEEEEELKQMYQFKEKEVQVDLLPHLPKLKDFLQRNIQSGSKNQQSQELQIIIEKQDEQEEKVDDENEDKIVYQNNQKCRQIQTDEIKYRISDTIKKQNQQQVQGTKIQEQPQVSQFQEQNTPNKKNSNKKVSNQRSKRQDIMAQQGSRIKTECQYYVPLQQRYQQIINKKEEWLKSQIEIKKQQEEEQYNSEILNKSMDVQAMDPEEFQKQQMSWLEKRNDHILQQQIKKDNELLQSLSFKPELQTSNKKKGINNTKTKIKVEDRLLDYQQRKQDNLLKLENKYLPTFKPNLQTKQLIQSQHLSQTMSSQCLLNTSFNNNNNLWQ